MDTVPPFFPAREDDEFIWGRGACDTKGIIASMITRSEICSKPAMRDFGLLFVVGEERNSAGRDHAGQGIRADRSFLINGEPTENKLALGSKGALRYEVGRHRQDGAFRLSPTGRFGDREIARCAERNCEVCRCPWMKMLGAEHAEHRHHLMEAARPT
jgi:acetylornithine deacetylase